MLSNNTLQTSLVKNDKKAGVLPRLNPRPTASRSAAGARRGTPQRVTPTSEIIFHQPSPSQRGSAAIYIALLLSLLIVSSALILSGVLTIQLRLAQDVVSSERAFYAANSGVEEALYQLVQQTESGEDGELMIENGAIQYDGITATYQVEARTIRQGPRVQACISSLGEHTGDQRRLQLGPEEACNES